MKELSYGLFLALWLLVGTKMTGGWFGAEKSGLFLGNEPNRIEELSGIGNGCSG